MHRPGLRQLPPYPKFFATSEGQAEPCSEFGRGAKPSRIDPRYCRVDRIGPRDPPRQNPRLARNVATVSSSAHSVCPLRHGHDRSASTGCMSQKGEYIRRETVMTMDRSASGKRFWLLAVGVWACLSIAGCSSSGSAADRGAGDVSPAATPATSATPASGGGSSTPATTTSQTTTTTATPAPSATTRARLASEVSIALLDTYSFVAGVHVVATPTGSAGQTGSSNGAGAKVTSTDPKCAPFVAEASSSGNAGAPGVTGYASIAFQADGDALPFLIEEITTVGTADHVAEVLASLN